MSVEIRPCVGADLETLRSIMGDPSLTREFERQQGPHALERTLADPHLDPTLHFLGFVDGEPAGFAGTFILTCRAGQFASVRLGVVERFRRRGLGSKLLAAVMAGNAERHPECVEVCLGAVVPNPGFTGFVTRHGFEFARTFWLMERPRGGAVEISWPAGIERRGFEDRPDFFADLSETYNAAFGDLYHGVISTPETTRALITRTGFDPSSVVLAYRNGRCVGFCFCELLAGRGEIEVLGTAPEARGIGLGRALLRWGVAWIERSAGARVTLTVDGENPTALKLYRSESFEIALTREVWRTLHAHD